MCNFSVHSQFQDQGCDCSEGGEELLNIEGVNLTLACKLVHSRALCSLYNFGKLKTRGPEGPEALT